MIEIMSLIRQFFGNKLGASILGILAIAILIWFAGPYVGITQPMYRLILIGVVLLLFGMAILIRRLWAQLRGGQLQQKIQGQDEQSAGRQLEIELLKEKMADAIAALKSSELGVKYRGNAALYALPWYMIIGPSAAGKSTLLRNSGLHFPFANQDELQVKGFGGTRNCDWWFADEAVILDTAGRYTTEDDDQPEWRAFLSMLKKHRPRLPINGIIVAMSLVDILTSDAEGLLWHVKVIRERIEELHQQLGFVFPVYLTFTKCDLLQGFNEFYTGLSEQERAQVWGMSLHDIEQMPYPAQMKLLETRLSQLYAKLTQIRFPIMAVERNPQRKARIYDFPEQYQATMPRIFEFIKMLFKENPYQETPRFVGIYFTSGTQEGTPIARLVGEMRTAFGYVEAPEKADAALVHKSYFIKDLFSKVIFPCRDMAAKTKQRLRWQHWFKSATIVSAGIASLAALMLYSASFTSNVMLLHRGISVANQMTDSFASNSIDPKQVMPVLSDSYEYYQSLVDYREHVPLHLRLGLYRGNKQIEPLQDMLVATMKLMFMQPIKGQLEQQLQTYSNQWPILTNEEQEKIRGAYYTTLKDYLMLAYPARVSPAEAPSLGQAWTKAVLGAAREQYVQASDLQNYIGLVRVFLTQLQAHNPLLNSVNLKPWPIEADLVVTARRQLYSPTNANNLYAQLQSSGVAAFPAVTLHDLLTGNGANLLHSDYHVPAMYTVKGWHEYVQPTMTALIANASQGDWVIDVPINELSDVKATTAKANVQSAAMSAQLTAELRQRYFTDYAKTWFEFLNSVRVTQFSSLESANSQLPLLADEKGPLVRLLQAVALNTEVPGEDTKYVPELKVPFEQLRQLIAPVKKQKPNEAIKNYLAAVLQMQGDLQRLSSGSDQQRDAQQYASQILSGSGNDAKLYKTAMTINSLVTPVDNDAARDAVKNYLLQPVRETWRSILFSATHGLQKQWQAQVYNSYQQNIAGKFPFATGAMDDVAMGDLISFMQPKTGTLWAFIDSNLGPYLYQDATGWHEQQWLGVGAGFSPDFLNALAGAKQLAEGLFKQGNGAVGFNFQIYPEPTPGVSQIILLAGGQTYRYRNGPQLWQSMIWPGNDAGQNSELTAVAAAGLSPDTLQANGPWGLFRLLSHAHISQAPGDTYRASWTLNGGRRNYQVSFLIRGDNHNSVFRQLLQEKFNLPVNLFNQQPMS